MIKKKAERPLFAFPMCVSEGGVIEDFGMTMRDYFAGRALGGMLADPNVVADRPRDLANCCYEIADAMVERSKT